LNPGLTEERSESVPDVTEHRNVYVDRLFF